MGTFEQVIAGLLEQGVEFCTAPPGAIVTIPGATPEIQEFIRLNQNKVFKKFPPFHPCSLCFDPNQTPYDHLRTKWLIEVYQSSQAENHPPLDVMDIAIRMAPYKTFASCAVCVAGEVTGDELCRLDPYRTWAEGIVTKLFGPDADFPVFFGSTLPGLYHPRCVMREPGRLPAQRMIIRTKAPAQQSEAVALS